MTAATKQQQARDAARKARDMANKLERAAGVKSQADIMAERRASQRDLKPPPIKDRDRRAELEGNDAEWLRFYLPSVFKFPFTKSQHYYIDTFAECLEYGATKCVAAPRGDGKSSIARYLSLKYALARRIRFPLILNASGDKAKKTLSAVKNHLRKRSGPLVEDYPLETAIARYIAPAPTRALNATVYGEPVTACWSGEYMILPQFTEHEDVPANLLYDYRVQADFDLSGIIMAVGWKSEQIQGCNVFDIRPDFVLLDDLDSRDSLASEIGTVAEKIESQIETNVSGLRGMGERLGMLMLCTVPARSSAAYKYSDPEIKPAWSGVRVRRIEAWPVDAKRWEKYIELRQYGQRAKGEDGKPVDKHGREAHRLYEANFEAMNAGAKLSNPHDFDALPMPDGSVKQLSALQKCYDFIADHGLEAFETEYQNDPPADESKIESKLTWFHVADCAGDQFYRQEVSTETFAVVRGVDVRKIELHDAALASDPARRYRIADYNVRSHGTSETTVEQAESLILEALRDLAKIWQAEPLTDEHGTHHAADLVLIDKGWLGNWTEDGEVKTWVQQPVELFCLEAGIDRFLPAKGAPNYQPPAADRLTIVGDNWHINRGRGKNRICDEVIWNADHWHQLVEELFMLPEDSPDRFELFAADDGIWTNHKALGGHIESGARQLREQQARGTRSRKPRFVRDHWWDSLAMCLVGASVLSVLQDRKVRQKPRRTLAQMAGKA